MGNWITEEELEILLRDIHEWYGYDFHDYSKASLKRRVNRLAALDQFPSFAELRYRLKSDEHYLRRFVEEITVNVTEMFRDPDFYRTLRERIIPVLATYPFIRIWHAGCATGEEVYSMAILLKEENLLHKSLLYATDLNPTVLEEARKGIFSLAQMKSYSENYILSGGKADFSSYYTAKYGKVKFEDELREKMIFSTHNLVSDSSFNEFQLILCRNVLIYFEKDLQNRVFELFDASLEHFGFIGLGSRETLRFTALQHKFTQIGKEKIWRKKR
ncbi:MAG: protein-glutamate O-methyltransferase CheR [Sphingobacteriales bacterium]|nr:MAG: protein-glutamate O-methyltransferase CheR [Sphingobacteriales bacterium]